MTFLPELKRLMDAATKGPWLVSHEGDYSLLYVDYPAQGIKLPLAEVYSNMQETDAKLIACLVNHAPALAELVEAAEKVLIGGNHLACLIGNHPPYGTAPEIVRKHYLPHHQDMYEAWCCWNEIMLFREALAKLNANDTNDANDGGKHEG